MSMRCFFLVLMLVCSIVSLASAQSADAALCENAVAQAERAWHIPIRLLSAVSRVESGRYDEATHSVRPWPWTINAAGQGYFYPSRDAAISAARQFLARGIPSIDVGCMQINLHYHAHAFASLEQAFDPALNAGYAGNFLQSLFHDAGSWQQAVGQYHSMTPDLGGGYARRVMAVWQGQSADDLYSTPTQLDAATRVPHPYPFNRAFSVPARGFAPRARIINLDGSRGASLASSSQGRTLSAYRSMPTRLSAAPFLRLAANAR